MMYSRTLVAKYAEQQGITPEEFCERNHVIDPPSLNRTAAQSCPCACHRLQQGMPHQIPCCANARGNAHEMSSLPTVFADV